MSQPLPLFWFITCWAFYNIDYNKHLMIIGHFRTMLTGHVFTSGSFKMAIGCFQRKLLHPRLVDADLGQGEDQHSGVRRHSRRTSNVSSSAQGSNPSLLIAIVIVVILVDSKNQSWPTSEKIVGKNIFRIFISAKNKIMAKMRMADKSWANKLLQQRLLWQVETWRRVS